MSEDGVLRARALVLHDLEATGTADPSAVSALEAAVTTRRWWVSQWEEGNQYVVGLVAQDVQDALLDSTGRWPICPRCEAATHSLYVEPEIGGPDPVWVCEETGTVIAPVGELGDHTHDPSAG